MKVLIFALISLVLAILLFLILSIAIKPISTEDIKKNKLVEINYEMTDESCEEADDKIFKIISESKGCVVDSDCTVQSFGCPFGCQTAVKKFAASYIWEEIKSRENSNCVACQYRCYSPDKLYSSTCNNNKCELKVLPSPSALNSESQ